VSTPPQPVPPTAGVIRVKPVHRSCFCGDERDTADSSWTAENKPQCPGQDRDLPIRSATDDPFEAHGRDTYFGGDVGDSTSLATDHESAASFHRQRCIGCVTSVRLVCASCRSEYARASFGDGDGVLGVRRVRPVCRAQGPAVGIDNQTITASCPPRFKREGHARPQQQSAPMPSAIGDVGILVHGATQSMPRRIRH